MGFGSGELVPELLPTICYAFGVLSGLAIFPYVMARAGLGFKTLKKQKPKKSLWERTFGEARNAATSQREAEQEAQRAGREWRQEAERAFGAGLSVREYEEKSLTRQAPARLKALYEKMVQAKDVWREFSTSRVSDGRLRNAVVNGTTDYQKIKTAEIEIPVIAEDVLVYQGGELGSAYPDVTRLFYSKEAISDPDYLETVQRSPLQVQTHEKNTSEFNRGVDGWPLSAWWDEAERRVKVRGVLHGEDNVRYAEENRNQPNFGTSAYISFLEIDRTPGIAPNGKPYDAVVRKAVNNHIAILPNVRDPKNVILAMNAVKEEGTNAMDLKDDEKYIMGDMRTPMSASRIRELLDDIEKRRGPQARKDAERTVSRARKTPVVQWNADKANANNQEKNMEYEEFKGHMNAYEKEKDSENQLVDKVTNAVLEKMNASKNEEPKFDPSMVKTASEKEKELAAEKEKNKGKNAEDGDEKPVEEKAGNSDEEKKEEKEEAANALPSESMVKDFSDALGIRFEKTPTLKALALVAGVNSTGSPAELIAALNAKRETLKRPESSAQNSSGAVSIDDLIKSM